MGFRRQPTCTTRCAPAAARRDGDPPVAFRRGTLAPVGCALLLLLLGVWCPPAEAQTERGGRRVADQASTEPAPHFFPAARFVLPMQHPQGDPLRVELLVSEDAGKTWKLMDAIHYRERRPSANQFTVNAPRDGRFWFTVRTLFPSHAEPAGPPRPDVLVVVDTQQPELTLRVLSGPAGELVAQWEAADTHLDPRSLRLEYQVGNRGAWQPVPLKQSFQANAASVRGETVWWPNSNAEGVNVRAVVQDRAGNRRQAQQWHPLTKVARKPTNSPTNSPTGAPSSIDRPQGAASVADASSGSIAWNDPSPERAANAATRGAESFPHHPATPREQAREQGTVASAPPRAFPGPSGQNGSPTDQGSPVNDAGPLAHDGGWTSRNATATRNASQSAPVHPPVADRSGAAATPISRTLLKQLPNGDTPSMSNSKQFELDYDVDSVGSAGVARVELYRTLDAGRTWSLDQRIDEPNPRQPLRVSVQDEGVYGYRIVVVARNGLASRRPGPGDQADLWIGVDVTSPAVRLTGAVYGKDEQAGKLAIRWQADDALFGERPVTLKFSQSPDGPWSTIASGLPNTGEYFWAADPRTPQQVYLRIEVRDSAGNQGIDQLERPIRLEGLIPRGRIRSFRPIGG